MFRFLSPGALTAVAVGVASLAASGCENSVAAPGVGASLQTTEALAVLPPDADVVGMMDLAAARQSDALSAVTGGAGLQMLSPGGSAEFDAFVRQTGFDPGRDLDRVYLAAPAGAQSATAGRAAFVGYGRFSRERVERFLATQTEHPLTTTDVDGVAMYLSTEDGETMGVAFPNDQMVLAGDEATVRQMLARIGGSGSAPSADLQALLDRVAFPDGAWFVARHLDTADAPTGDDNPAALAARLSEGVAVSMDFGRDGVPVRAFVQSTQPADLADVLRGGVSAARVGAADEPSFLSALDAVEVDEVTGGVTVEAFLPTALLAEMHADRQP
ncbi:MAG TPA: hypothetical protein VGB53_00460 [Rubricoccaceae bacterium]|jgi:hypothetical protein